jgi:hypothetical protein
MKVIMAKNLELSIFEIIGSPLCVTSSDGQKVYERLEAALKEKQSVILSFFNITILTPAFLNAAIGQLYGTFRAENIRSLLKVDDIQPDDRVLLKRVIEIAKQYFKEGDL